MQTLAHKTTPLKRAVADRISELQIDVLICEQHLEQAGLTAEKAGAYRILRKLLKQTIYVLEGKL